MAEAAAGPRARAGALALVLASGFAGLGYQIVWTQQCALWLGHEAAAVLAVVAAFFGGLALGGALLAPRLARSARPARGYAACELVIGAWSLALAAALAPLTAALLDAIGAQPTPLRQSLLAFGGAFMLLLPATTAMGATLPAVERLLAQRVPGDRPWLAALYAGNTLGAVLGVLATAFWLLPAHGLARTAGLCALLNGGCALGALWLGRGAAPAAAGTAAGPTTGATTGTIAGHSTGHSTGHDTGTPPSPGTGTAAARADAAHGWRTPAGRVAERRALALRLFATGALGIGYEVLVVRVLRQVAENTVYTFALLLAVYLLGSAAGAALWQRHGRTADPRADDRLLAWLALACALATAGLWAAADLKAVAQHAAAALLGPGMGAALAAEALVATAAFALPTLAMGALFSQLAQRAQASGLGLGPALALNTLGGALAPALFGLGLLPAAGAKAALLAVAAGYIAVLLLTRRGAWRRPPVWAGAALVAGLAALAPPLAFVDLPEGGRLLRYLEGAAGAVSVVEDADGVARLYIDNRQQEGSSATLLADARQALLPLLLHPAPRQALFLGLGTGVTASSAAADAGLQVTAVELLPEVIEASRHFTAALDGADASGRPPRLQVLAADARRYVRAAGRRYDLVVSDNFHPARSGSGALYTVEHFQAVRARLAEGGLFCQWLPLHQLDLETLRSIVRSFQAAFPQGQAVLATLSLQTPVLGLLGRADDAPADPAALRQRLARAALPWPPARFGLGDELAVLGSLVAGPAQLARWSAGAPLNTDDHPVVAYRAPRVTYAPQDTPAERLLALLQALGPLQADAVAALPGEPGFAARLAAYGAARQQFLAAGRGVQPSGDVRQVLAQVQQPLLAVLRTSPEFRPAFDPLLRMAQALGASDPAAAATLLQALTALQPGRADARAALAALAPAAAPRR